MSDENDQPELPLYHRSDLGTEREAAHRIRVKAERMRRLLKLDLTENDHNGETNSEWVLRWRQWDDDWTTPEHSIRPRLTELTYPNRFGNGDEPFAVKTMHTRPSVLRPPGREAVYVKAEYMRACCLQKEKRSKR